MSNARSKSAKPKKRRQPKNEENKESIVSEIHDEVEEEDKEPALPECNVCACVIKVSNHLMCPYCEAKLKLTDLKPKFQIVKISDLEEKINVKSIPIDEVICKDHGIKTTSFCKTCELVFCSSCLKEKRHNMHDTSGDITEMIQINKDKTTKNYEQVNALSDSIKLNLTVIKDYIEDKNSDASYASNLILYKLYTDKAKKADRKLNETLIKIDSLNNPRGVSSEYFENVKKIIEDSSKLINDTEKLLNLNEFIMKQRMECEPNSSTERIIKFQLDEQNSDDLANEIYINEDIYIVSLKKIKSDSHKIEFKWKNPPKKWGNDLKVNIFFKLNQNDFEQLNPSPVLVSIKEDTKDLKVFNVDELLSLSGALEPELAKNSKLKYTFPANH